VFITVSWHNIVKVSYFNWLLCLTGIQYNYMYTGFSLLMILRPASVRCVLWYQCGPFSGPPNFINNRILCRPACLFVCIFSEQMEICYTGCQQVSISHTWLAEQLIVNSCKVHVYLLLAVDSLLGAECIKQLAKQWSPFNNNEHSYRLLGKSDT
jgi:hypothetical protein